MSGDRRRPVLFRWRRHAPALLVLAVLATGCAHRDAGGPTSTARALGGADCARTEGYDVVIVGAGLAGLAAGKELRHLGRSVLLLEATDRVGGRGFVGEIAAGGPDDAPVAIDYGGAWIHGVPTNPLTGIVDAMGFRRARSELDVPFYRDGRRATPDETARFNEAFEAYEEALGVAAERVEHEAAVAAETCAGGDAVAAGERTPDELCAALAAEVADALAAARLCEAGRRLAAGEVAPAAFCNAAATAIRRTSDVAADYLPDDPHLAGVVPLLAASAGPLETAMELDTSSATDAAGFAAGEDDLVDRGMGAWVEAYGEGLPVCLDSPVTRVDYDADGVVVAAAGRRYAARHALVTVPVGVLRAGTIEFAPPLPAWKREAIERLAMGHMQKVILPFREDVFHDVEPNTWVLVERDLGAAERELAAAAGVPAGDRRVMAFVLRPLGAPIAIGFYGGRWARLFESLCAGVEDTSGPRSASGCDDPAIDVAVAALAEIYGEATVMDALLADGVHVTRWSLEPYTLGAYSVPLPGSWDQREVLARPVAAAEDAPPRLFFAGEAASRAIYNGSYPGAFETGLAAARDIHAELLATE